MIAHPSRACLSTAIQNARKRQRVGTGGALDWNARGVRWHRTTEADAVVTAHRPRSRVVAPVRLAVRKRIKSFGQPVVDALVSLLDGKNGH